MTGKRSYMRNTTTSKQISLESSSWRKLRFVGIITSWWIMSIRNTTTLQLKTSTVLTNCSKARLKELFRGKFWKFLLKLAIVFSWLHWGEFTGEYKGNQGKGGVVELSGFVTVSVTEGLKITDIKVFTKPEKFLQTLRGEKMCPKKQRRFILKNPKNQLNNKKYSTTDMQ